MIKIKNLIAGYGKNPVINDISFSIDKNKTNVILGPNGSGKTTLLKTIAGIINKGEGSIHIDEKDLKKMSLKEKGKILSYMPQVRNVPKMNVEDFLLCSRYPYHGVGNSLSAKDYECINKAAALTDTQKFFSRNLTTLSGGERQRVYLAMALSQETDLILLDEPASFLDVKKQFEIMELIKSLKKEKTILMVCHDIRMGLKYADKIIVMDEGKIVKEGTNDEILSSFAIENTFGIKINKIKMGTEDDYIINME